MSWFTFALLGSLCLAASRIVARSLLRKQGDPLMFTAVHNAVAGIVLIPFIVGRGDVGRAIAEIKMNRWGLVAAGSLVLGGVLLLGERDRLAQKIIGTAMVVLGVVVLKS